MEWVQAISIRHNQTARPSPTAGRENGQRLARHEIHKDGWRASHIGVRGHIFFDAGAAFDHRARADGDARLQQDTGTDEGLHADGGQFGRRTLSVSFGVNRILQIGKVFDRQRSFQHAALADVNAAPDGDRPGDFCIRADGARGTDPHARSDGGAAADLGVGPDLCSHIHIGRWILHIAHFGAP
jgi:hypothetical protein